MIIYEIIIIKPTVEINYNVHEKLAMIYEEQYYKQNFSFNESLAEWNQWKEDIPFSYAAKIKIEWSDNRTTLQRGSVIISTL